MCVYCHPVYAKFFLTTQDIRSCLINKHIEPNKILSDRKTSCKMEIAEWRKSYSLILLFLLLVISFIITVDSPNSFNHIHRAVFLLTHITYFYLHVLKKKISKIISCMLAFTYCVFIRFHLEGKKIPKCEHA
jgi:hypothetical protein